MSAEPRRELPTTALALATLLALALPPEVYPESGAIVALLLGIGLVAGSSGRLRWGPLLVGGLLLAFNLGIACSPARALTTSLRLILPLGAFALALHLEFAARRFLLGGMSLAGAVLGLLAVLQKFWLLPEGAAWARESGAAAEILVRLSGRPFATHVVPAALAGALLLALAATLALWREAAPRQRRFLASAAATIAVGLLLTGSLGGFVSLLAVTLLLTLPRWRALPLGARLMLIVGPIALAALLLALRPVSALDFARPDNPLLLRFGNWRGALLIALRQPFAGVGFGGYGALAPLTLRAGDQETIYAHNSWLQLGVEGGLPLWVLLTSAAIWLIKRWRSLEVTSDERWLLAGMTAFAVHNLFDFTAYLPGVTVAAAVLAGLAIPRRSAWEDRPRARWCFGLVLLLAALPWASEAIARHALTDDAGAPLARATRFAPWSIPIAQQAGKRLIEQAGSDRAAPSLDLASEIARRAVRLDPESPAGWHLLGAVRRAQGKLGQAWQALSSAALRHPQSAALRQEIETLETTFERGGLLTQPLDYGRSAAPFEHDLQLWDDLLLLVGLSVVSVALLRRFDPAASPIEAMLLLSMLLLAPWGEGGALPGARLARMVLLAAAVTLALFPLRRWQRETTATSLPLVPLLVLVPLLLVAGLSALVAPSAAGARDGFVALLAGATLVVLSWDLARRFPAWPQLVVNLLGVTALLVAALWTVQKGALLTGFTLDAAPLPLRVGAGLRPAADFLHPGHLGTFLIAAGLGWVATAVFAWPRPRLLIPGAILILIGLVGGARSSLMALLASGVVLAWFAATPMVRRWILLGLAGLTIVALGFIALRFSSGDPYMWRRLSIWRAAAGAVVERWPLGFGPGGFDLLAERYSFDDPGPVAHFGRSFQGPHSDLLGAFLLLGLPGGLLALAALGALAARALRTARLAHLADPSLAGAAAALVALVAHGLTDDYLTARPAAAVVAAILLGALAGGRTPRQRLWSPSRAARIAIVVMTFVALLGVEVWTWAADRRLRSGDPLRAAQIDPLRSGYWLSAARQAAGPPPRQLALALDRATRATLVAPTAGDTWKELAQIWDAGCRGPLAEGSSCAAAAAAWEHAIERSPHDALALFGRAKLADATGDPVGAQRWLERALNIEPNFLPARLALAHLLVRQGDLTRARAEAADFAARAKRLDGVKPESDYEQQLLHASPAAWRSLQEKLR